MIYLAHFSFIQDRRCGYFTVVIEDVEVEKALSKINILAYKSIKDLERLKMVYLEELTEINQIPTDGLVSYMGHYPEDIYTDNDLVFSKFAKHAYDFIRKKSSIIKAVIDYSESVIFNIYFEALHKLNSFGDRIIMSSTNKMECGKIVCVMATHKREAITTETLKMLKNQSVPLDIIVVGDSSSDREVATKCGCIYVNHDNKPLSKKWQAGVSKARELSPDAVMICGSDSWLSPDWCKLLFPYTTKFDLVGSNNFYACRAYPDKRVKIIHRKYRGRRINIPIGSGRMFSKRILDKTNWAIYPGSRNSALDAHSYKVVKSAGGSIKTLDDKKLKVMAIKSTWESLNSWDKYISSNQNVQKPNVKDPKQWLEKNFPGSIESLNRVVQNITWS